MLALTRIRTGKWWYALLMRFAAMLGALLVIILVAAVFYKDYASLFRNNKSIVKMVTPANYVSAVVKYSKMRWFAGDQTLVRIGEDAHKGPMITGQQRRPFWCWLSEKPRARQTTRSTGITVKQTLN